MKKIFTASIMTMGLAMPAAAQEAGGRLDIVVQPEPPA